MVKGNKTDKLKTPMMLSFLERGNHVNVLNKRNVQDIPPLMQCRPPYQHYLQYHNFLLISYRKRNAIDFYDAKDFRERLQTHSVDPDSPGSLATSLPGVLVYNDCREENQLVKWLDCSSFPPKKTCVLTNIGTSNYIVQDMCCVTHEEKQLLITTHNIGGVHAYFAGTDDLKWCVGGCQPGMDRYIDAVGITANEQGQLFVCDKANGCVQVLSTEGTFLATVLRNGEQRLGIPHRIRWCRKTKSLIITNKKQGLFSISVFEGC